MNATKNPWSKPWLFASVIVILLGGIAESTLIYQIYGPEVFAALLGIQLLGLWGGSTIILFAGGYRRIAKRIALSGAAIAAVGYIGLWCAIGKNANLAYEQLLLENRSRCIADMWSYLDPVTVDKETGGQVVYIDERERLYDLRDGKVEAVAWEIKLVPGPSWLGGGVQMGDEFRLSDWGGWKPLLAKLVLGPNDQCITLEEAQRQEREWRGEN